MMIGWEDIYKVLVAMLPLYFALMLCYGSVRWWGIFTPEHCEAINRLVSFFTLPLFTFGFTAHSDPFQTNNRFIAADVLSKVVIVVVLAACAAVPQSITSFIYAREYGLHADVLSTAVIFGMLASLPVLIAYYVCLGFLS
ncbi:protein that induces appearance of [PIN+] prion when overproduced [Asimina triloba]